MLLAASLGLVVIGGSVGVMTAGLRSEPRIAERTADVQGARVAMERFTRELRQGSTVVTATATELSFVTNANDGTCAGATLTSCRVTYECSTGKCTRAESAPSGGGTAVTEEVVQGVSSGNVFSYSPSAAQPIYIGMRLAFPASSGDDSITLTDGVTMRNATAPVP